MIPNDMEEDDRGEWIKDKDFDSELTETALLNLLQPFHNAVLSIEVSNCKQI